MLPGNPQEKHGRSVLSATKARWNRGNGSEAFVRHATACAHVEALMSKRSLTWVCMRFSLQRNKAVDLE
jgi:hypothetical protein